MTDPTSPQPIPAGPAYPPPTYPAAQPGYPMTQTMPPVWTATAPPHGWAARAPQKPGGLEAANVSAWFTGRR